jgi:hypothetical protein
MKINLLRLSIVWVEALPGLLQVPAAGPLGKLTQAADYAALFNALLAGGGNTLVDLPWPQHPPARYPGRNNFWDETIVTRLRDRPGSNLGMLAWRAAIPLKHRANLITVRRADRTSVEGWYYPHGVALSVTAWLSGNFDQAGVQQALDDLLHAPLTVVWPNGNQTIEPADQLAATLLDNLSQQGFAIADAGFRPPPMRIVTVIKAEHDPQEQNPAQAEAAMLDAVLTAIGGPPASTLSPDRNVWSFSRGRVIWRPDRFLSTMRNLHTLGCLHRNVLMGTLQVASLLRAVELLVANLVGTGAPVPPWIEPYARMLAGLVGRIYGGIETYAQASLRTMIGQPQPRSQADRLRNRFNLPPLT